jgi:hypothetical protein
VEEKRTASRDRVVKAGNILFGGGAIDCTVRNSRRPALLLMSLVQWEFLKALSCLFGRMAIDSTVAWSAARSAGSE